MSNGLLNLTIFDHHSECSNKAKYSSQEVAEAVVKLLQLYALEAYQCEKCHMWHVNTTHNERVWKSKVRRYYYYESTKLLDE